jgi:hypothetical protein
MQARDGQTSPEEHAPAAVRRIGLAVVVVLLAGAGYLISVRGEALIVDLAALGRGIWCF